MIQIETDNIHYIKVSLSDRIAMHRFPNGLIWDVNSYLSKQYKLYEYYGAKKASGALTIHLSEALAKNKYLCFSELDKSYISKTYHSEKELKSEYEKHESEIGTYDMFCEFYSMEQINELNYIAIKDMDNLLNNLRMLLRRIYFAPYKKILSKVESYSEASIHIGDHRYMHIKANNPEIISGILCIMRKYRDSELEDTEDTGDG